MLKNGLFYFVLIMLFCCSIVPSTFASEISSQLMASLQAGTTTSQVGIRKNATSPRFSTSNHYLKTLTAPAGHFFPVAQQVAGQPIVAAERFMETYRDAFGIVSSNVHLVVQRSSQKNSLDYVRFKQTYLDVPVFGAEVIVQMNASGVVYVFSDIMRNTDRLDSGALVIQPTIYKNDAELLARDQVMATFQGKPVVISDATLMIYRPEVIGSSGETTLVWKVVVTDVPPISVNEVVLIDAHLGHVVLHYPLIQRILDRKVYNANNTSAIPGTLTRAEGDLVSGDIEVDNMYAFMGDTYDFYFNEHGRDSIDGAGGSLLATVRYCDPDETCPLVNAYWNGTRMLFGEGLAVDDIVAHEFTHGVTAATSNLLYVNESGAINESFSDIWGEFIDLTNGSSDDLPAVRWLIGEGSALGVIRDMADPPNYNHPDSKDSLLWAPIAQAPGPENDYGGVHTNSGVGNKLSYLLTDGDTFNGYTVTGLGISAVADLFYEVQTNLLGQSSDYGDLTLALLQGAINLGWDVPAQSNLYLACFAVGIYEFPPPPNNDCVDAIALTEGVSTSGTTIDASGIMSSSCGNGDSDAVWYTYTPEISDNVTVSLCDSGFDTVLSIFDNCSGAELACNNNSCGLRSELTLAMTEGVTYYIRVSGDNNMNGAFNVLVTGGRGSCAIVYDNTIDTAYWFSGGSDVQMLDYGTSAGGNVCAFTFGYNTTLQNPGTVTISFFSGTDSTTCTGTPIASFDFDALDGNSGGIANAHYLTVNLAAPEQFVLPAGAFGYAITTSDGDTGPLLTSGGAGQEDAIYVDCALASFGGPPQPWSGFHLQVNTGDVVAPNDIDLTTVLLTGWSDNIVVATEPNTFDDALVIYDTDQLYVDINCVNIGTDLAGHFRYGLYIDNVLFGFVELPTLSGSTYHQVLDTNVGQLSVGPHTLEVRCDDNNEVIETNEVNNIYTKEIVVVSTSNNAPDLLPHQLPTWDDPVVISSVVGTTVSESIFYNTDTIYIDFSCINSGNVSAGTFKYGLYLDGVLKWFVTLQSGLGVDTYSYAIDAPIGPLPEGVYTLEVRCDYQNDIAESNEVNNIFVKSFTVVASTSNIRGYKFNDIDNDGIWDPNEPGVANWQIYIDGNINGQFDVGEPNTLTDITGAYVFENLPAGEYRIGEVGQSGWVQTFPGPLSGIAPPVAALFAIPTITTTDSQVATTLYGALSQQVVMQSAPLAAQSASLIGLNTFRNDPRFSGIDGSSYAVVVIDTGADLDHDYYGIDLDGNNVADRIVYQYDFADNDNNASDVNGHGSNVAGIVASSDSGNKGMAPGANLIILKVFTDTGSGNFSMIESALQWVVANINGYNIVSVNMSLGDSGNHTTVASMYGIGDELVNIAAAGVVIASAAGNAFYTNSSAQGVAYPASDQNTVAVGAVYDATGAWSYSGGAEVYAAGADRICPFGQRDTMLSTIFAPGAPVTNASLNNGTVTMHGTSQASPHIAGIAVLAQQVADMYLGRRLSLTEFTTIIRATGVMINDGDDEDDNVINTDEDFLRIDVFAMAEAILALEVGGFHTVVHDGVDDVINIDFGNHYNVCGDWGFYESDLDQSCYVDIIDFILLSEHWLSTPGGLYDLDQSGLVDFADQRYLISQWGKCTDPVAGSCAALP